MIRGIITKCDIDPQDPPKIKLSRNFLIKIQLTQKECMYPLSFLQYHGLPTLNFGKKH
jgi:hypothetical protein